MTFTLILQNYISLIVKGLNTISHSVEMLSEDTLRTRTSTITLTSLIVEEKMLREKYFQEKIYKELAS